MIDEDTVEFHPTGYGILVWRVFGYNIDEVSSKAIGTPEQHLGPSTILAVISLPLMTRFG